MLARCTACSHTFRTDDYGRQRCPSCGAEVVVQEPVATAFAAPKTEAAPPAGAPSPVVAGPIPWERRRELGFWKALGDTLKLALAEPTKLFSSMRYDSAEGAHLYFVLVAVVPQLVGTLVGRLMSRTSDAEIDQAFDLLRQSGLRLPIDPHALEALKAFAHAANSAAAFLGSMLATVVGTFLELYLLAAIAHLVLLAFGKAKGGWTATLKAFAYAYSPAVLGFVSLGGCMGVVVLMWASILQIIGLKHAHRTTSGWAVAAVVGWEIPFFLFCCIGPAVVAMLYLGRAMGGG